MMIRALALAAIFDTAAAAVCADDVLTAETPAVNAGSTTAEACTAPAADTPADGACTGAGQTYVPAPPAVWATNSWTTPAATWTSAGNTWAAPAATWTSNTWTAAACSDASLADQAACEGAGSCNDDGDTGPADQAACEALFSDAASTTAAVWTSAGNTWTAAACSDASLTDQTACEGAGSCNDDGDTGPADQAACEALSAAAVCSDASLTDQTACEGAGSCNDDGDTGPADQAACEALSAAAVCSDTQYTDQTTCEGAGTCDNADGSTPADQAACEALFSGTESCTPPTCTLVPGTDCSTDTNGATTGCTYTTPVPAADQAFIAGSCSDSAATYTAPQAAACSDNQYTDQTACEGASETWTAAVAEACTDCGDPAPVTPPAATGSSGASTVATAGLALAAAVAQAI